MARDYAPLPYEYLEELDILSDAEFGRLARALLVYSMTGQPIALCGNERFFAKRVMLREDRYKEAYKDLSSERSEAGKIGAAKRWQTVANDSTEKQSIANDSKNGYSKSESNSKSKSESDSLTVSDETVCCESDVQRVIDAWNSLGLQTIRKILPDSERGGWLKKRIKDYGLDSVLEAIENVRQSSFLMGNNKKGWCATFDWFIRPNNFPKVLDGNYSEHGSKTATTSATNNPFLKLLEDDGYD